ncbi:MAG: efflux RND transporter permease subunit [Lewinellaceae bacterium]|nr:efflux RND transporter permease subunit [Saprospiraceae bacterium]MCB9339360.1 efflux RND transporter permease subunit [Lewinellaceae bacterium]
MPFFFQKYRTPILFFILVVLLGAGYAFQQLQISLFPEITFPKIKIIADNGEQPVDLMMIAVTKPLEQAIREVPGTRTIRSTTSRGSSELNILLDWKANIFLTQQLIESKIAEIRNTLPPMVQITVARMNPAILPVFGYSLEGKGKSLIELKKLATLTVKPFFSQIEGVGGVQVQGGKEKEYHIELLEDKMAALGITPQLVASAVGQTGFISSNGYLNDYRRLYLTLTDAGLDELDDLQKLVLRNDGVRTVMLKDVATLRIAEKVEYIKINANGSEGVLVNLLKQPEGDLATLAKNISAKLPELQQILPKGVELKPIYQQSDFVDDSIKSVQDALLLGLGLAILITILFLRSLKASMTILLIIPLTLGLTMIALYAVGYTLNIMTLGAIAAAIGLMIDDAIVVVEQIHRIREEHPEAGAAEAVHKAMVLLMPVLVGSSLSTLVIFIPFSLMSGVAGAYFKVLAYTMILALACSFLAAAIGLPVIYQLLSFRKSKKTPEPHGVHERRWVSFFIKKPWLSLLFVGLLAGAIVYVFPRLETGFLPEMDEGTIVLDYDSPPGTSIEETNRMLNEVDAIIAANPDVESYNRRTGTQMGFFITEPSRGDYLINLKKARSHTTEEVIDDIRQHIEGSLPVLIVDFGQVIGDMLGDLMSSVQPIEIKVFGNEPEKVRTIAKQVTQIVEETPGTADAFNGIVIAGPNISFLPDEANLYRFGLTPADLQFQLETRTQGVVVAKLKEQEQMIDVRMMYPGYLDNSLDKLKNARMFLPDGSLVPLNLLTKTKVEKGVSEVERENLQLITAVTARLNNRDLGSTIKDIQRRVKTEIALPQGYRIEYGGSYAEQQKSFQELLTILILASLLVFTVLLVLFRDLRVALVIIFVSVLGVAGCYLALYLTHTPLNVGSYTGIIMIVGIIAENSIFTFQQFNMVLENHTVDEALNYSIAARLRPKLMTASGAIIALMPLALGIGTGAQMHQPLAIAVIGGLVLALPLLLVVLPTMLRVVFRRKETTVEPEIEFNESAL